MGVCKDRGLIYQHPNFLKQAKPVPVTFTRSGVAYGEGGSRTTVTNLLSASESQAIESFWPYYSTGTTREVISGGYEGQDILYFNDDGVHPLQLYCYKVGVMVSGMGVSHGLLFKGTAGKSYGMTLTCNGYDRLEAKTITATGEWQWITHTFIADAHTQLEFYISATTVNSPCYIARSQVELGSVANEWCLGGTSYNIDGVRVRNLLTANQSDGGDTLGNLNESYYNISNSVAVRDTTDYYSGTGSWKVTSTTIFTPYIGSEYHPATPGLYYTGKVKCKTTNPDGCRLYIRFFDSSNGNLTSAYSNTLLPSTGWGELTVGLVAPANTAYVRIFLFASGTGANNVSIWWDKAQLELGSVTHDWCLGGTYYDYNPGYVIPENTPRYKADGGILVEEATTNLLTANQSSGGDTYGDTTGFETYQNAVISYTTQTAYQGNGCIKVVTPGVATLEGVRTTFISSLTTNSGQFRVKAPVGATLLLRLTDAEGSQTLSITGTGNWEYYTLTRTSVSGVKMYIVTYTTAQAITFYVDMLQLEAKAYNTSWTLGGTTRNAETLTIPSSVLNIDTNGYSNLLTANQSNAGDTSNDNTGFSSRNGATLTRETTEKYSGNGCIKCVTPGSVIDEGLNTTPETTAVSGVTYNLQIKVKAPVGATLKAFSMTGNTTFTGTGDWQTISFTAVPNSTGINIRISTVTTAQAVTFYVDELQISATSTAKPWILGGTQVNTGQGTIEMEFYANSAFLETSNTSDRYIICHTKTGDSAKDRILIRRQQANNQAFEVSTRDGIQRITSASKTYTVTAGNWYKIAISWDQNYIRIFLNGVASTSTDTVYLPISQGQFLIGYWYGGFGYGNTYFRNMVVSKRKRSDSEIAQRASSGFVVDKDVTYANPFINNLNAKRVAKVA